MSNLCKHPTLIGLWLSTILLFSCSTNEGGLSGGIEGTGIQVAANGSVTKLGSIYVNGIHFNTDNTTFIVDGQSVEESTIKQGMVVYVTGKPGASETEASADQVIFDYLVEGKIEDIVNDSSDQRIISMLGYSIYTTEDAMIEGGTFDQLSKGDYISVSGFIDEKSQILATRIDIKSNIETISLSGRISSLSKNLLTLTINEQKIDYSQAVFSNTSLDQIAVGKNIKIKGQIAPESTTIIATEIQLISEKTPNKKYQISLEGVITDFVSMSDFTLNGINVDATLANISGDQNGPLGNGKHITIKGHQTDNNLFVANDMYTHFKSSTRFSGAVSNIDYKAAIFTVSGIDFHINRYTRFDDLGPRSNRYFNLEDISIGDRLDVFSLIDNNQYIAVTVRRKPQENNREIEIKGQISSFTDSKHFYLSGIEVNAENIEDDIFDQLSLDIFIIIKGIYNDSPIFTATEIYVLKLNCTSHKEDDCSKQGSTPWGPKDDNGKTPFEVDNDGQTFKDDGYKPQADKNDSGSPKNKG